MGESFLHAYRVFFQEGLDESDACVDLLEGRGGGIHSWKVALNDPVFFVLGERAGVFNRHIHHSADAIDWRWVGG